MRIELVIDELRLLGFDARQRHTVADAVEREAAELVAHHARERSSWRSASHDVADAGQFELGADARQAGRAIARAVMAAVLDPADSAQGLATDRQPPDRSPERRR